MRRFFKIVKVSWLIICVLFLATPETSFPATLYLKSVLLLRKDEVRIKDIARVDGERKDGIISGKLVASNVKRPFKIDAKELQEKLADSPEKIDAVYGGSIWIVPLTSKADAKQILAELNRRIVKMDGGRAWLSGVELNIDSSATIETANGDSLDDLHFRFPKNLTHLGTGKITIPADILSDDDRPKILHRQRVVLNIKRVALVPVAAKDIPTGATLKKEDFLMEKRTGRDAEVALQGDPLGLKAVSAIKRGDILTRSSVQRVPAVRRGSRVEVYLETPSITLRAFGFSQADGEVGDTVPVRIIHAGGKKTDNKRGRVTEHGTLLLVP